MSDEIVFDVDEHIAIIIQKVQSYFVFYYGCCTDAVCAEMRR